MSKSNAAVLRQGFLPFGGRKALRIRHDAMRQELPPFDAPKAYMPPLTLGMALDSEPVLAMDASLSGLGLYGLVSQGLAAMYGVPQFIGYAALSNLSQNGLIRAGVESVADEMTRKWLELQSTGDDDNAQMLTDLTNELKRLKTRQHFNDAGNKLGYFGGCLIYLDMGEATDAELLTPLVLDAAKVPVGSLKRLDLEAATNSNGQAKFTHLPSAPKKPLYFYISKDEGLEIVEFAPDVRAGGSTRGPRASGWGRGRRSARPAPAPAGRAAAPGPVRPGA